MQERLTKKCVKVVKAKSAKVQGACAYARKRGRILEMLRVEILLIQAKCALPSPFILQFCDIVRRNRRGNDRPRDVKVVGYHMKQ